MIWGLDYSSDGSIWYTDQTFDSIWRFDITSAEYNRLEYPSSESLTEGVSSYTGQESMPQRLKVVGSDIFVNDFTGGKITMLDIAQGVDGEVVYTSIQSPLPQGYSSQYSPTLARCLCLFVIFYKYGVRLARYFQNIHQT